MEDKYEGCLIGLAIGDVLGAPLEFWPREKVVEYVKKNGLEMVQFKRGGSICDVGFYTDDTSMTICLAESLLEKGFDLEHQLELFQRWFFSGYATPENKACYGIGQQTFKALGKGGFKLGKDKENSVSAGGNGSLMRLAPIGLYYQGDLETIKKKSLQASYLTHNNNVTGWTCVVLNAIISLIITGEKKESCLQKTLAFYENDIPDEVAKVLQLKYANIKQNELRVSGFCIDTLKIALWSWITTENFEESLKKVILLGNDTDTFAAVTGAITGCYYGYESIPAQWKTELMS